MPRPADLAEPAPATQRVAAALSFSIGLHLAVIGLVRVAPVAVPAASPPGIIAARIGNPAPPRAAVTAAHTEAQPIRPEMPAAVHPAAPQPAAPAAQPAPVAGPAPAPAAPQPAPAAPVPADNLPTINIPLLADPTYYTAREVDLHPRALAAINPIYPDDAAQQGITGWVTLKLKLDEAGTVENVEIVSASPPGVFDQSALEAFRAARFAPAQKAGRPVKALVLIKVRFELER